MYKYKCKKCGYEIIQETPKNIMKCPKYKEGFYKQKYIRKKEMK